MTRGVPLIQWKARSRRGLPSITRRMFDVLVRLKQARDDDFPFIALEDVDPRTLRALCGEPRGWVFESPGLDGLRYTITGAGEKALKVYTPAERRGDGICPDCGIRPKHVSKGGRKYGYCQVCERKYKRNQVRLRGGKLLRSDHLCARCKKRPHVVNAKGKAISCYCRHCKNVLGRRAHKKARALLLERVRAGEFIPCSVKGCNEPRYVTANSVQEKCFKHHAEYQKAYNDKRRPGRRTGRKPTGRPRKQPVTGT